jgi:hypothetical protein
LESPLSHTATGFERTRRAIDCDEVIQSPQSRAESLLRAAFAIAVVTFCIFMAVLWEHFRIMSGYGMTACGAKRTFTEKLTSEKRQQEILLGCREDALPANGAPGSQLTCADWRAQGLRQRR